MHGKRGFGFEWKTRVPRLHDFHKHSYMRVSAHYTCIPNSTLALDLAIAGWLRVREREKAFNSSPDSSPNKALFGVGRVEHLLPLDIRCVCYVQQLDAVHELQAREKLN